MHECSAVLLLYLQHQGWCTVSTDLDVENIYTFDIKPFWRRCLFISDFCLFQTLLLGFFPYTVLRLSAPYLLVC